VKRLPVGEYRVQNRGGKGVQGGLRENDFIEHFFVASTKAYLLCFTDQGQVYWLKVYRIPQAGRTSPGRAIANVLSLKPDEKIASIVPVREFVDGRFLTAATRLGLVKKTPLMDYSRPKQGGIRGINLEDGDALVTVRRTGPGDELVLNTRNGMAIRFAENEVRSVSRDSKGVKGVNLGDGDVVVGMVVADPDGMVLTVCENGYGKRIPFGANLAAGAEEADAEEPTETEPEGEEAGDADAAGGLRYRKQKRGGKGLRYMRTAGRNGPVVAVEAVRDGDEVILISQQGMVTRSKVADIRVCGRNALGVRVMNLNEGDKLATLAKVAPETVEPE
jgi:DNA gyrase subunit A